MEQGYNLLHDGILALAEVERNGMRVDLDYAKEKHDELTDLIDDLEEEFKKTKFCKHWGYSLGKTKLNLASPYQLEHYLYKVKKIKPPKMSDSGKKGSTDEESLRALNIPELDLVLRIRKLKKLRDTYLHSFISESVDGFIHPVFNLHFARTFRSSSDSPNFQNIPIRDEEAKEIIRKALFPREGHQLLEIDYSGVEVCIAACYHKDPTMIKYINDPKSDMHADMAKQIFFIDELDKNIPAMKTLRNGTKNGFVFPQFYGDYYINNVASLVAWTKMPQEGIIKSEHGLELPSGIHLGEHLREKGIKSIKQFTEHLKEIEYHFWNKRFPVYNSWRRKWWSAYQKKGYFDTYTGFRISGVWDRNFVINAPVQGSAFHCLLWSLIEVGKALKKYKMKSRIIGQIHDSIVFDIYPPELDDVLDISKEITCVKLLKEWDWIIVPLEIEAEVCEVDQSWYYKKEIKI